MDVLDGGKKYLLCAGLLTLALALQPVQQACAMDPRFELDMQALGSTVGAPRTGRGGEQRSSRVRSPSIREDSHAVVYTVRAGDNLFKILMRDYGLTNEEAEACIENIRRENNILDIKRLKVGQKITIPMLRRKADGSLKKNIKYPSAQLAQSLKLESPVASLPEQEASDRIRQTWDSMIPPGKEEQKPISLSSSTFSLTLDPKRYPVYAAMDGGKILVDSTGSIPPLVKSLITEKDPSIRIVSDSAANNRRFLSSLLASAGFYSLEENFSMDFGSDPKLTVNADFKIEKTKNSLVQQDVTLVNAGRDTMPPAITDLLKKEGFSLLEPFASLKTYVVGAPRQMFQITAKTQPEIVDSLLGVLSITPTIDRQMDVFAADNNGISLSVKAERYFERGGKRFVITRFDGDPITYTLFRILETKGYQVVILDSKDDFRKICEKLLTRMNLNGSYRQHMLVKNGSNSYALQMSGIMLDGATPGTAGLFFTDLNLDRVIRDVLTENGYTVTTR